MSFLKALRTEALRSSKAKGLTLGADVYITKPYSNAELVAKVKALLEVNYEEAGD